MYAFVAKMTFVARMIPRSVCNKVPGMSLQRSILVTGVFVCRSSFPSLISFSRMNAMSLYGHKLAAAAVSVAPGAPFTLRSLRSSSFSTTVTSFPSSGASCFSLSTSSAAAPASGFVQNVLQPVTERHSHGTPFSST